MGGPLNFNIGVGVNGRRVDVGTAENEGVPYATPRPEEGEPTPEQCLEQTVDPEILNGRDQADREEEGRACVKEWMESHPQTGGQQNATSTRTKPIEKKVPKWTGSLTLNGDLTIPIVQRFNLVPGAVLGWDFGEDKPVAGAKLGASYLLTGNGRLKGYVDVGGAYPWGFLGGAGVIVRALNFLDVSLGYQYADAHGIRLGMSIPFDLDGREEGTSRSEAAVPAAVTPVAGDEVAPAAPAAATPEAAVSLGGAPAAGAAAAIEPLSTEAPIITFTERDVTIPNEKQRTEFSRAEEKWLTSWGTGGYRTNSQEYKKLFAALNEAADSFKPFEKRMEVYKKLDSMTGRLLKIEEGEKWVENFGELLGEILAALYNTHLPKGEEDAIVGHINSLKVRVERLIDINSAISDAVPVDQRKLAAARKEKDAAEGRFEAVIGEINKVRAGYGYREEAKIVELTNKLKGAFTKFSDACGALADLHELCSTEINKTRMDLYLILLNNDRGRILFEQKPAGNGFGEWSDKVNELKEAVQKFSKGASQDNPILNDIAVINEQLDALVKAIAEKIPAEKTAAAPAIVAPPAPAAEVAPAAEAVKTAPAEAVPPAIVSPEKTFYKKHDEILTELLATKKPVDQGLFSKNPQLEDKERLNHFYYVSNEAKKAAGDKQDKIVEDFKFVRALNKDMVELQDCAVANDDGSYSIKLGKLKEAEALIQGFTNRTDGFPKRHGYNPARSIQIKLIKGEVIKAVGAYKVLNDADLGRAVEKLGLLDGVVVVDSINDENGAPTPLKNPIFGFSVKNDGDVSKWQKKLEEVITASTAAITAQKKDPKNYYILLTMYLPQDSGKAQEFGQVAAAVAIKKNNLFSGLFFQSIENDLKFKKGDKMASTYSWSINVAIVPTSDFNLNTVGTTDYVDRIKRTIANTINVRQGVELFSEMPEIEFGGSSKPADAGPTGDAANDAADDAAIVY